MRRISLIGCLSMLTALLFAASAHAVAPTVKLTSPLAGPISGIVTLDAVAAAGTTRVDYFLDGRPIAYDATCCLWDDTWDSTTAADGGHALA